MKTFSDRHGREWDLTLDYSTVRRVKRLCDVDLLDALDGKLIPQLATEIPLLVDCVFAICKPQADAREIDDENFGAGLDGTTLEAATHALMEAIADFSVRPDQRQVIRDLVAKIDQTMSVAEKQALARVAEVDAAELVKKIEADAQAAERSSS